MDFTIEEASDGVSGLNKALNGDHDVLIVDWMLPGLSGLEIVKQYHEHKKRDCDYVDGQEQ